jgi:hypothetical protein
VPPSRMWYHPPRTIGGPNPQRSPACQHPKAHHERSTPERERRASFPWGTAALARARPRRDRVAPWRECARPRSCGGRRPP